MHKFSFSKMLLTVALFTLTVACSNKTDMNSITNTNAVLENIRTRTSIRTFESKPVEAEKIETMLRAAMAAPSAMNCQPWAFVVVNASTLLTTIGTELPNTRANGAPLAIVVCGDTTKTLSGEAAAFWIQDASNATENLLLAAHSLGLGAVWTGIYPSGERVAKLKAILNLPEHIIPLCVVPVGYPAEEPQPKDKWKPENIHYNNVW